MELTFRHFTLQLRHGMHAPFCCLGFRHASVLWFMAGGDTNRELQCILPPCFVTPTHRSTVCPQSTQIAVIEISEPFADNEANDYFVPPSSHTKVVIVPCNNDATQHHMQSAQLENSTAPPASAPATPSRARHTPHAHRSHWLFEQRGRT